MDPAEEILDIVDEQDRVVGTARRGEVYRRRLLHRCVFILCRDAEDRIFVHRRTATKLFSPLMYDLFVGGVVGAGESYAEAAVREAEEELGVSGIRPAHLFKFLFESPDHSWWCDVYEARWTGPVHPQVEEVDWHAFLTEDEVRDRLTRWPFVADGLEAWRRYQEVAGPRPPGGADAVRDRQET
ncbi:NUDIX hydrolase [Peterkaempfera bronchialis]|uniref:NUDIX domain-containing protein n=1 Tax=Peterkaempfera bronchialis TaxID=2126346 RepID=A0A345SSN8_9ACTN|nr:NUDIX domain-containing protein [Peterkaempfera bronchialis]AXI76743.1 NUDIX domain-containing protein [Peterkaempfera bronchialis]